MHEYTSTARVWGLTCPGFPEEVSRARRWTRDILRGSPLAADAELIVSELSANAILHTASGQDSGSFRVALAVSAQVIAMSVTDDGGAGTGVIAHRVVVRESDGGHTVTAELFTDLRGGGHPC
ncbi:ATP-binding protein [Streptomyces sp. NPDC005760]|uniref:ATP-binding protein n=1 Tax=Streptomyces sp. NPDC005760 TaxID=3156718 RepID=UPI0033FB8CFD